jgi:Domain of unknown function (DUF5710)
MPIKIAVPLDQKEDAKKLGAIWVPDVKTWVIPDHIQNVNSFKAWLPQNGGSFVRFPYLIARSRRECWKWHKETPLIALGAKIFFTTAFGPQIPPTEIKWEKHEYPSFFVNIEFIDDELSTILRGQFPFFQEMYSKKLGKSTWVNTCVYCQTIQGDDYNIAHANAPSGGYLNEKKTLFRGKNMEQIQLRFDYYIDSAVYDGEYYWDGFSEAE